VWRQGHISSNDLSNISLPVSRCSERREKGIGGKGSGGTWAEAYILMTDKGFYGFLELGGKKGEERFCRGKGVSKEKWGNVPKDS